jgi:hypothetical protein
MGETKIVLLDSELEKAAGRVLEKAMGGAADGVVAVAGDLFGGWVGDKIREWRTRNLINQLAKTAALLREKGVPLEKARALPMGEAYAMFEEASKQDDPDVSDMWAALLANAMDDRTGVSVDGAYIATLRTISGAEAHVLKFLRERENLEASINERRPELQSFWFAVPEKKAQLEAARSEMERLDKEFFEKTDVLLSKFITRHPPERIDRALSVLIAQRCIFVIGPSFSRRRLLQTKYHEGSPSYPIPSTEHIADALNELSSHTDGNSGGKVGQVSIIGSHKNDKCNYRLTTYGNIFISACESK